jgi:LuxR family transcriptional regulator, maltose regulon positive regulatory protein
MVEAPSVTPERDALLATKLHVPASRPGQVLRPRLTARLDEGLARGLVLACAPAGYGKTVLLADWARRGECPVAWLSLDAGDNDPARFWRHAVAALDQARPGIGERVAPLLGLPAPSSFQGLVTALINDLAGEQALLLLDDYHLIGSQQVHESLAFLLEHRPAGLRVGLASRSDPPLPLPRLRARGQLTEIRQAELRFTSAEAWELLQQAASGLPEALAAALAARTEGWAAGLQLAALSLRGHHDAVAFVAAFTGSHRYILDYLAEEVLEQQDAQLRTFLLETSVLERLSGPLCDAVTGREGSQALLEAAERAGLFLIPLDEVRGWWRYHHLFADLLQARLRQGQPGKPRGLHRAAAAWFDAQGLADETIRHALAAGDAAWAARLIERHYDAIFLRGESATIQGWISALPAELAQSRPRLLLAQAWMALVGGDVEAAGAPLDAAERAFGGAANEPFEPSVGRAASLLANVPAAIALARAYLAVLHGDAEGMAASASPALPALDEQEWVLHSASLWILAIAEWVRGRLEDAERGFAASVARWRAAGQRPLAAWACLDLGRVQRSLAAGLVTLAWIRQANGDPSGTQEAIAEAERVAPSPSLANLFNPVPAQRARLLLAQGDIAEAARWAQEGDLRIDDEPVYQKEREHLVLARVLLTQDQPATALALLDRLHAAAAAQDRVGSLIEIGALRALALAAAGEENAAVDALAEALTLACPQGYVRVFADEGAPMAALLARLIAAQRSGGAVAEVPLGCLARLHHALRAPDIVPDAGRGSVTAVPGLVDPLTGRELEVLQMLAAGRSNRAIASQLVVSLDTVKKHVSHILGKLGAANRTEAVARARELSLIP